jgi:hypothetical protein
MRYGHSAQPQMLAKMSQGFRSLVYFAGIGGVVNYDASRHVMDEG